MFLYLIFCSNKENGKVGKQTLLRLFLSCFLKHSEIKILHLITGAGIDSGQDSHLKITSNYFSIVQS